MNKDKAWKKQKKKEYLEKDPLYVESHSRQPQVLSLHDLAQISDEDIIFSIVRIILNRVGRNFKQELKTLEAVPEYAAMLYATWLLESEVMNGGFEQFFFNNPEPTIWQLAVRGYERFGLFRCSSSVMNAILKSENENVDFDAECRVFDDLFEEIVQTKIAYIRQHQSKFVIEQKV